MTFITGKIPTSVMFIAGVSLMLEFVGNISHEFMVLTGYGLIKKYSFIVAKVLNLFLIF
jgi:hypothetical protein